MPLNSSSPGVQSLVIFTLCYILFFYTCMLNAGKCPEGFLNYLCKFPHICSQRLFLINTIIFIDNSPRIAFYANTVKDNVDLGVHHTLIFGNDVTNEGNFYHHATGNFIPNVSGVYVFHVQILLCSPGHELRTELVVEGVVKAAHYTGDTNNCSNGGGMAILHVNAGDSVWVRVRSSDGANNVAWESSFAGFLLYPQQ